MTQWRLAHEQEDDLVVAMFLALNREDPGQDPVHAQQARRTLRVLREQPWRGRAVVLEVEGSLLGYALLMSYWSNEVGGELCCIDEMYVAPAARGRGYCSALIASLTRGDDLWPNPVTALALEVTPDNARAAALYERLGFVGHNRSMRLRLNAPREAVSKSGEAPPSGHVGKDG